MLIDLHASPGNLSPTEFARACADAGLDAVVVADVMRTDRLDDYLDALDELELLGFAGVALPLDRGTVVVIPRNDDPTFRQASWRGPWTVEAIAERLPDFDGLLLAAHPYCRDRDVGPMMGDKVYFLKGLGAVETRIGKGNPLWDRQADRVAEKRRVPRIGSSSGDASRLGVAMTALTDEPETQAELIEALQPGKALPFELDDPANPRDRRLPEPAPRRERDDRGPRRDRDDRGRGRRDGDRRGGRRDDRRGGRGDDRRGGGRGRGPGGGRGRR